MILDASIFDTLRELLDEDTLASTYREFLAVTRARIAGAPGLNDVEAMHLLGHTVRGTAGMLGAVEVADCAGRLERETPGDYKILLAAVDRACAALEDALRKAEVEL